ncbi:hypothetical protein Misp01_05320 [Microtetraspora sp. NBRC 13810]|uniref:hypothetical protein n=1 Tax=Microtetraspora sp. NBRC 13810 TaxID=3030990 RepID=UPI0024A2258F|nr:hypothetical protein [Microtetraspora sp. NBRC 13810]GLW05402.1 hypothetical protein Misp01_05320 [Microtetraspora sp. NBRC 13810]
MTVSSGLLLGRDAARWGARFYLRHFWLVCGVSTIPTVQRFAAVRWGDDLPSWAAIGGEALTGVSRVVLFYLVLRLAFGRDPVLAGLRAGEIWRRLGEGIDRRPADFVLQFVLLGAAFVVLDVLPGLAVGHWVAAGSRELVMSILVAAKNPTVIAFTFVWMAGVARLLVLREAATAPPPVTR